MYIVLYKSQDKNEDGTLTESWHVNTKYNIHEAVDAYKMMAGLYGTHNVGLYKQVPMSTELVVKPHPAINDGKWE
jgi:hypothetical protein